MFILVGYRSMNFKIDFMYLLPLSGHKTVSSSPPKIPFYYPYVSLNISTHPPPPSKHLWLGATTGLLFITTVFQNIT